jgi:hypothetical protein
MSVVINNIFFVTSWDFLSVVPATVGYFQQRNPPFFRKFFKTPLTVILV